MLKFLWSRRLQAGLVLCFSSCATLAFAVEALPRDSRVPGGVAVISLPNVGESAPQVSFNGARVWVVREAGGWRAVVGIALSAKPGAHAIEITTGNSVASVSFDVRAKKYPTQKLTLSKAMVDPPTEVQARIAQESQHLAGVRNAWRASTQTSAALTIPAQGRLSSRYGVARVLNGKPRSSHAGLDVAVPTGTSITAPADGVVLDAGDYYYCGRTMFVDHGNGLITMHCHLSEFIAKVGDAVKRGEQIARSGATGRATGPHLHWSVYLNGTSVDPELFLAATGK